MKILGIKQHGIQKYQEGTNENGIQLNYTGPQYYEMLEKLKKEDPMAYNRLQQATAQSETSEISRPWADADGNVRRSTNIGAGFVSGTDPVGSLYIEGVVTAPIFNPIFKWFGKLARIGKNQVSSKILSATNKNYQASIGNPVQIKQETEYYMPNQLIDEFKRGKEAAAKFFEHPVVQQSYSHNQELAKRLGINIPDRPENIGAIIRWPTKVNLTRAAENSYAQVAQTHLGDPDATISYQWMPYDKKTFTLSTIHENLHRGYYSAPLKYKNISKEYYNNVYKPQYSFYRWKTSKLLKPEYQDSYLADISGGEAGPNFIDLGRDLGLKLGQKYPGYEAVKNMLQNYKGFKSWMIPQLNMSEAGMRHIWDAMTGKYFAVPLGVSLISKNVKYENNK